MSLEKRKALSNDRAFTCTESEIACLFNRLENIRGIIRSL